MERAQAIVELFLALSLVIVLMLFLVTVESESIQTSIELIREAEAQVAVKAIADAADAVFIEGGGATRLLYVTIPPNFNPGESYVGSPNGSGNVINMRLDYPNGPIDVQERTNAFLTGTLPNVSGLNVFQITMDEYFSVVHISRPVVVPTTSSVQVVLEPGENKSAYVTLTYYGKSQDPITVRVSAEGEAEDWIRPYDLAVYGSSKNKVSFTVFAPELALPGTYEASLHLEPKHEKDKKWEIVLDIPINIVVIRGYEWMRLEPVYKEAGFLNSTGYGESYTTNFILCNDHTETKTFSVEGEAGKLEFDANGTPVDFGGYAEENSLFNESGYWFNKTTFLDVSLLPFGGQTSKGFTEQEGIDGGLCSSFIFYLRVNDATVQNLLLHIWELTNNSSIRVLNFPYLLKATSGEVTNVAVFNVTIDSTG